MISYKRDVLERQSLSEVKMGRGSPICKRLWNTLKITFLNVRLQRLCKSHHLQCITSSKDSEKLEKSLCVRNRGRRVLRAKEEGDLPVCYQRSVQKPASLMVWGCVSAYGMGSLHVLEGTMNAERYIKVLEQHMLPSRRRLFQQDNTKSNQIKSNHFYCHITTAQVPW